MTFVQNQERDVTQTDSFVVDVVQENLGGQEKYVMVVKNKVHSQTLLGGGVQMVHL